MYIVPGQYPSWHGWTSLLNPTQSFPPVAGGGLLHSRVRTTDPTPHVTLHCPVFQGPQLPSTVSVPAMYTHVSLSTIILNSRDQQGLYGFPPKLISFNYWPLIIGHLFIGMKPWALYLNPFKQPKCTLELKLLKFKFYKLQEYQSSAYLPDNLFTWPQLSIYHLNYWDVPSILS